MILILNKIINFTKKFYLKISFYYIFLINLDDSQYDLRDSYNYEEKVFYNISDIMNFKKIGYNFDSWDLNYFDIMFINQCIAFCAFVDKDLGHTTWLATSPKSTK